MDDPFDLRRFVEAQEPVWAQVREELRRGQKTTHWMWFVFPQVIGLGLSAMSRRFAIRSRQEAEAYLAHPVLGPRLRDVATLVVQVDGRPVRQIFGSPDDAKLWSCMTLFAAIDAEGSVFHQVLRKYFDGRRDPATLERI